MTRIEQFNAPSAKARRKCAQMNAECTDVSTAGTPITPPEPSQPAEAPARVTKLDQLIALLQTAEGTTIDAMCAATGWQAHSLRGALAGALKRKGFVVASIKPQDGPRRYQIGEKA